MQLRALSRPGLHVIAAALLAFFTVARAAEPAPAHPDVLFIAIDDLNDWITLLDPAAPIPTPNLQRLARRGVSFTRAYAAAPSCNPSRVSLLTGKAPATTGVYGNTSDWRRVLSDAVTLPQAFMQAGYYAAGAGKIFHHHYAGAFHDTASFKEFKSMPWPPDAPMPPEKLNGLPEFGTANTDWGAWPRDEADALDVRDVDWCIARLRESRSTPLFLACGLFRPHMPFFVPARWLEAFPADRVRLPEIQENDLADVPRAARALVAAEAGRFWQGMSAAEAKHPGTWRSAVRHYQAAGAYADAQVGRLLDALDATPHGRSTIVVLWSDHGYQLGEKDCWEKFTLWEKATHVPLIVVAPGLTPTGATCDRPVSLLDLYPTLLELAGLPARSGLDGESLVPQLRDPARPRARPAVMTYLRGNHAVRTERWRYIRYADGSEELYDHTSDPNEWRNVADVPAHAAVKAELARWLPAHDAPAAPDMPQPRGLK